MKTKEDIKQLIEKENVEFIRLQFTDMYGTLKNIAVTPGQMERVLENRFTLDGRKLFGDMDIDGEELYLWPDLDSFVILPWRPQQGKVGKFLCDIRYEDGTKYELSPRTVLENVVEMADREGYEFFVDPECEFFLFHTDENDIPTTITHEQAGLMDVGPLDRGENARRDMVLALEEMGFEIESSHHEKSPAQHEISFKEGTALQIADSVTTFRFAVRSIAKRFGMYATFMPKPMTDEAGSGMHLHFTLYGKDGKNVFRSKDKNSKEFLSDEGRYFIGGILKHARGICAVTNPIVNSYKRILSGFEAPRFANWSTGSNGSMIRAHKCYDGEIKIELRIPDASANPYLAIAVCMAAGIDGIKNKIEPTDRVVNGSASKAVGKLLPENLKEAVKFMKDDKFITEVIGDKYSKIYMKAKTDEWNEYMKQVSKWEIDRYLIQM